MNYGWNVDALTFGEVSRDFYYANLLIDELMEENFTEVRRLLESKKANPNTVVPERGVAPLHLLAGLENEDFSSVITLQAILRSGGDPNVRSEEGLTPVHVAAMWGRCKVLEILLSNGGDPELIDYKMFLNAEDYAIKEQQWDAYGVISTFSVIAEGEGKAVKWLEDTSSGSENSGKHSSGREEMEKFMIPQLHELKERDTNYSDDNSSFTGNENRYKYSTIRKSKTVGKKTETIDELNENALRTINKQRRQTNVYESIGGDKTYPRQMHHLPKEKVNKLSLYGDAVSESCDWIKKHVESVKLDKKAIDTIRKQRLNSKIYQTKGLGVQSHERVKEPPLYEESETCDWIDPRESKPFHESTINMIKKFRTRSKIYQNEHSEEASTLRSTKKITRSHGKKLHKKEEDSEMFLCGYTESSSQPRRSQHRSSRISDCSSSDFDERGVPNQRMLCKMSRIFLFMLKKRHIYQKIK